MFDRHLAGVVILGTLAATSITRPLYAQSVNPRLRFSSGVANRLAYRQAYERYYLSMQNRAALDRLKRLQTTLAREQLRTAIALERTRRQRLSRQTFRDAASRQEHYSSTLQQRIATDAFRRQSAALNAAAESEQRRRAFEFHPKRGVVFRPDTGAIRWPALFDDARFRIARRRIDGLFADRTTASPDSSSRTTGLGSRSFMDILKTTKTMRTALRAMKHDMDSASYAIAKRFLDSLVFEATFVAEYGTGHSQLDTAQ